jgi:BirA family biotin operon repressor/biotin-[acetyl-CoA-carboxylase] ligase
LIENVWQGDEWKFAVVGIGINVNQTNFGDLGTKAVSLKQITGKDFEPIALAKELCNEIQVQFENLLKDPSQIIFTYKANLYKLQKKVKLKKDNRVFEAIIKDVTTNGQLVVENVAEERFDVGEVEWII